MPSHMSRGSCEPQNFIQRLSVLGWPEAGCHFVKWLLDCLNPEGIRETIRITKHSCNFNYEDGYRLSKAWLCRFAPSQTNLILNHLHVAFTELSLFSLGGGEKEIKYLPSPVRNIWSLKHFFPTSSHDHVVTREHFLSPLFINYMIAEAFFTPSFQIYLQNICITYFTNHLVTSYWLETCSSLHPIVTSLLTQCLM